MIKELAIIGIIGMLLFTSITVASTINIYTPEKETKKSEISINSAKPSDGYTLYTPEWSKKTFLINNTGKIVKMWNSSYIQGLGVYLLENGNMIRSDTPDAIELMQLGGGFSGRIEMFNWDGDLIWEFEYYDVKEYCLHNDIEPLPNGNVLLIVWEKKSAEEAIQAGINPELIDNDIWMDYIMEIKPIGKSNYQIVWEWHAWDHLIQEYDSTKDNYGIVSEHPELLDINLGISDRDPKADYLHMNSLDYNERFDQILVGLRNINEIVIIDHSTTTQQAAGHNGGRYGKGGDLLYRWGNPKNYQAGSTDDQKLFAQHDAQWIEPGCPGDGGITYFNNGWNRPGCDYSSVEEIMPPVDGNGNYQLTPGSAYGPTSIKWKYTHENPNEFYSEYVSGAQRLPSGNTFICSGWRKGLFLEVTPEKEIAWEYNNPYPKYNFKSVFKTQHYMPDYPGLGEFDNIKNIDNEKIQKNRLFSITILTMILDLLQKSFPILRNI